MEETFQEPKNKTGRKKIDVCSRPSSEESTFRETHASALAGTANVFDL